MEQHMNHTPAPEPRQRPILPHAVDDERLLLGWLIAHPAHIEASAAIVWPDDFFVAPHGAAFAELAKRNLAGKPITLDGVSDAIGHTLLIDDSVPTESIEAICLRIRSVAIMRETAANDGVRSWKMGGCAW